MRYWLVKSDPDEYSFHDLVRDKKTNWTGVRNYQAKNNLSAMAKGDVVLVYHSQTEKAIVGSSKVSKTAFPDPTEDGEGWVCVELTAGKSFKNVITLEHIKSTPALSEIALIKQSRLSVMPLTDEQYECILELGG